MEKEIIVYWIERGQDREMNETFNLTVYRQRGDEREQIADETFYSRKQAYDWLDANYSDAESI